MDINDKVIIMTGASSGIGRAAAIALSKGGGKLVLAARSKVALDALAAKSPPRASGADWHDQARRHHRTCENDYGKTRRIDVLVNNAGRGMYGMVENAKLDDYRAVVELNGMLAQVPQSRRERLNEGAMGNP